MLSLRQFGGSLAQAPMLVNVVGGAERSFVKAMDQLDAEVKIVDPVDRRRPSSNKLRMLELAEEHDFDVLIALDCDVIVKGDLTGEVRPEALRAVPADRDVTREETWIRLYDALAIALPPKDCLMTVSGQRTYPYFNSGVMFVPHAVCEPLLEHWRRHLDWILGPGLAQLGLKRLRKDQIPLAAALATAKLRVDPLPVNLNLGVTASQLAKPYRKQWGPPFIFHYHSLINEQGFLLPSPNPRINPHLDEFNRMRSSVLGVAYPGLGRVGLGSRLDAILRDKPGYPALRRSARGVIARARARRR